MDITVNKTDSSSMNSDDHIHVRDGLSQAKRPRQAKQDGDIAVDEQSFTDLLVYGAKYAGITRYHAETKKDAGTWEPFFLSDEAIILSLITKFDLKGSEKTFLRILEDNTGTTNDHISAFIHHIRELASTINRWHKNLKPAILSQGSRFISVLEGVIQKSLVSEIHSILSFQQKCKKNGSPVNFDTTGFTHIWKLSDASSFQGEQTTAELERSQVKNYFSSVFYAFYNAIAFLQQVAPLHLKTSLINQDHSAQSSLFIAFVLLYGKTQTSINNFTRRHFDFYYKKILHSSPRELKADHVYLLLNPQSGNDILLPGGTTFIAGKDLLKKDLLFVSTKDVLLNSAKVKLLRTVYLEKDKLVLPGHHLGFITNIKSAEIPVSDQAVVESLQPADSWPLFGVPKSSDSPVGSLSTEMGFALASNILLLKEGLRKIRCSLNFTADSYDQFDQLIQRLANKHRCKKEEIFEKIFQDGFRIFITTSAGWFRLKPSAIDCNTINPGLTGNTIEYYFQLGSDDPAIINYAAEIHGGNLDTQFPVLRFLCNPDSYLYIYPLVKPLVIQTVRFHVEVSGLTDLVMYNNLGKLDVSQPIRPFGISPTLSSFLIIGSSEIRSKKINNLELSIEWSDLPKLHGGFESYYSAYDHKIKNDSFRVKVEALEKGNWTQQEGRKDEEYLLFDYDENSGLLSSDSLLKNIYVPVLTTPDFLQNEGDFKYDNHTQMGFVKLTLSSPSLAFGDAEYAQLISKTIFANAKKKIPLAMPNSPYNPMLNKISINYSATAEIKAYHSKSTGLDKFHPIIYHIHPWGFYKVFPSIKGKTNYLFPQYEEEGNLMIGIKDCMPPATLTLFFHLKNDSFSRSEVPDPQWHYLDNNEWHRLKKHEIISDSTNKFLNSGIITLAIPEVVHQEKNTIFPESLIWLKVSLEKKPETVCSLIDIKTQAIEAVWENDNNSCEHLGITLPAGNIKKTQKPVQGVKEIVQPMSSFGGVPPEAEGEIYRRVSERIKHKNRTGSAYDYEQMILQKFPEILKVKCFPNVDIHNRVKPGSILIAVIPKPRHRVRTGSIEEPLANSTLLKEIETFIMGYSSPFADIKVCNPVYEKLIVQCSVKFEKGMECGYYLIRLNNELIERLSPWGRFEEDRPRFGETIKCADILSFIQNRSYVAFVTGFSMLQVNDDRDGDARLIDTVPAMKENGDVTTGKPLWNLKPSFLSSILISAARHSIKVITQETYIPPVHTGIDQLELDTTFIIQETNTSK
jgi:hypothetical protein